jgi:ubiquinone biosynthesis monooxygenase Coq7
LRVFVAEQQQTTGYTEQVVSWGINDTFQQHRAIANVHTPFNVMSPSSQTFQDSVLATADATLRTLFARPRAQEASPAQGHTAANLSEEERRLSGALMRVNHVGEVCAQALYLAQAAVTRDANLRAHLLEAAEEETDHLAWTRERLDALGDRPSWLNPLWFTGAFAIGLTAAKISDRTSLGFVVETERQVSAHLQGHLERLPEADSASRAVVARMQKDEERHATQALAAGALELPPPARGLMRVAAKIMTKTAHYI